MAVHRLEVHPFFHVTLEPGYFLLVTMTSNATTTETGDASLKKGSISPINTNPSAGGPASSSSSSAPPASGPSPLLVGKSFVKQYYQTLSSSPELVGRFYKASSVLSHGLEASAPAAPVSLGPYLAPLPPAPGAEETESAGGAPLAMKDLFSWAVPPENDPNAVVRFDFGRGAIDAQESVSGGILLVVTGHMTLPADPSKPRPFVHTFLLSDGAPTGSRKKQFYVTNDVLRFVAENTEEIPANTTTPLSKPDLVEEETQTDLDLHDFSEMGEQHTATLHKKEELNDDLIVKEQRLEEVNDRVPDKNHKPGDSSVETDSIPNGKSDSIDVTEETFPETKNSDPKTPIVSLGLPTPALSQNNDVMVDGLDVVDESGLSQIAQDGDAVKTPESSYAEAPNQPPQRQPDNGRHRHSGGGGRSGRHRGGRGGRGSRNGGSGGGSGNNLPSTNPEGAATESEETATNSESAIPEGNTSVSSHSNSSRSHGHRHNERSSGATGNASQSSNATPPKPKIHGSWASLVAGGAVPSSPSANSTNTAHSVPPTAAQAKIMLDPALGGGAEEYKPTPELEGEDDDAPSPPLPSHPVNEGEDVDETIVDSSLPSNPTNEKSRDGGAGSTSGTSGGASGDRKSHPVPRAGGGRRGSHSNDREHHQQHHRVPESTLFIKNIPDRSREHEIRSMFEPYAASTGKRILQITLVANRGFCFVDFDGPDAVSAILTEKENALAAAADASKDDGNSSAKKVVRSPFFLHGRQLEVERKIIDPNRRTGGGRRDGDGGGGRRQYRQRSASPGDGLYKGGGRGGHHRRSNSRGGGRDRPGGGGHRDKGSAPGGSK